jgi:hypothetical protein
VDEAGVRKDRTYVAKLVCKVGALVHNATQAVPSQDIGSVVSVHRSPNFIGHIVLIHVQTEVMADMSDVTWGWVGQSSN